MEDVVARARGAMLGLAAGNCLGVPYEFGMAADLRAAFADGGLEMDPHTADAPMDDDLAQAVVLGQVMLLEPIPSADTLAAALLRWAQINGSGIGALTADVISELQSGTPATDAARVVWERSGRMSAGNGAVMRCAPVAIRWHGHPLRRREAALASAAVTHADPRCAWTTVATVEAIAAAITDAWLDLDGLAADLDDAGAPGEVTDAIRASEGAGIDDWVLDGPDQGYTILCMQVALWALQREPDVEHVLGAVVRAGGDTDTNGAVAGAVVGARATEHGIPERWLRALPEPDLLGDLAEALATAG